ncbi:MAG: TIGR02594 family protein [Deltaproteobacteria bacterium]|nr:MAG: TIGR02594 family protein [Deltaproteobacteria bacterium]
MDLALRRIIRALTLFSIFLLPSIFIPLKVAPGAELATSFGYPMNPYAEGHRYYEEWTDAFGGKYHAAQDLQGKGGDPVYAVANGVVSYSHGEGGEWAGYGYLITIDPALDPKGRERGKPMPTAGDFEKGCKVTPWCAALVNCCLKQVGTPALGYATAESWLQYGVPLASPVYGCVTVVPGHVAFLFDRQGDKLVLLGGNQSSAVTKSNYTTKAVLGYRWPSFIQGEERKPKDKELA